MRVYPKFADAVIADGMLTWTVDELSKAVGALADEELGGWE